MSDRWIKIGLIVQMSTNVLCWVLIIGFCLMVLDSNSDIKEENRKADQKLSEVHAQLERLERWYVSAYVMMEAAGIDLLFSPETKDD